mgnify:CR=1 FL=1|tara:strand:- start:542 stop:817 length:276 start_codon:yes stop_codon:yes gene_type:complete
MKEISICIPRVEKILRREVIYKHIQKMEVGIIKSMVEKPLRNEDNYKRIIIRMLINPFNRLGAYILDRFSKGENVKLVYNLSTYWKLVCSH